MIVEMHSQANVAITKTREALDARGFPSVLQIARHSGFETASQSYEFDHEHRVRSEALS